MQYVEQRENNRLHGAQIHLLQQGSGLGKTTTQLDMDSLPLTREIHIYKKNSALFIFRLNAKFQQ